MTTQTESVLTNNLNSLGTTLTIGQSSTSVSIGSTNSITNIPRINAKVVKPKVVYITTTSFSPTISDFFTNGTIFNSTYSSANPSTINDIITINLPTATAELEGMYFLFRKTRGAINGTSQNWTFTTNPASIVPIGASITTSGYPIASISQNVIFQRLIVCGYNGLYYWCFI